MAFEITTDGGVRIEGRAHELRDLAFYLLHAADYGHSDPSFLSDETMTSIEIVRVEDDR